MSEDSENFEQLRRLLALKRHEQPPPGYFDGFSRQVILRIKAGECRAQANLLERLFWEAPWVQRLWHALETRPILAGACGVAVCGLMITGILYSDKADVSPLALAPIAEPTTPPGSLTSLSPSEKPFASISALLAEPTGARPMLTATPAEGSLLGDISKLPADRATFRFPAGN
jgi:hypothetical protein